MVPQVSHWILAANSHHSHYGLDVHRLNVERTWRVDAVDTAHKSIPTLRHAFDLNTLWNDYGVVGDVIVSHNSLAHSSMFHSAHTAF